MGDLATEPLLPESFHMYDSVEPGVESFSRYQKRRVSGRAGCSPPQPRHTACNWEKNADEENEELPHTTRTMTCWQAPKRSSSSRKLRRPSSPALRPPTKTQRRHDVLLQQGGQRATWKWQESTEAAKVFKDQRPPQPSHERTLSSDVHEGGRVRGAYAAAST